jgi:hypothetical protein
VDNNDRRDEAAARARSGVTIALTVRQLADAGAAIAILLAVLVQGRTWRTR